MGRGGLRCATVWTDSAPARLGSQRHGALRDPVLFPARVGVRDDGMLCVHSTYTNASNKPSAFRPGISRRCAGALQILHNITCLQMLSMAGGGGEGVLYSEADVFITFICRNENRRESPRRLPGARHGAGLGGHHCPDTDGCKGIWDPLRVRGLELIGSQAVAIHDSTSLAVRVRKG
ncbi:hypothetical protein NDU88_010853 [Pleurodeles waltl]|uniref:Uncharacterized protein n=1 Tax=Pleurodeles waltl TaxID=8319 RepID=A0AAV7Q046_PLEWA|nr:hypothetical protein NDU88_010853 [Pleurodeles waltl]